MQTMFRKRTQARRHTGEIMEENVIIVVLPVDTPENPCCMPIAHTDAGHTTCVARLGGTAYPSAQRLEYIRNRSAIWSTGSGVDSQQTLPGFHGIITAVQIEIQHHSLIE